MSKTWILFQVSVMRERQDPQLDGQTLGQHGEGFPMGRGTLFLAVKCLRGGSTAFYICLPHARFVGYFKECSNF